MTSSRSALDAAGIVEGLTGLVGADAVVTDEASLRAASVDRFKKYPAVHGIFDGPFPAAIVRPKSTDQVAAVLKFADDNLINVVPAPAARPPRVGWRRSSPTRSSWTGRR